MRHQFWWIYGRDRETSKPFLVFGSDRSEDDCRQKGLEMLGGQNLELEVNMIPTRDISAASRILKGFKLGQSRDFGTATKRLKHKRIKRRLIL